MDKELEKVNATVFYSYKVCRRQAWLYYHGIYSDPDFELFVLGRLVHETSYKREKKEIVVDQLIKVDLVNDKLVAEIKRSSRYIEAAKLQLAYYLYYLKRKKGMELDGILLFPKERKREKVVLTNELEKEIELLLREIGKVLKGGIPQAERIPYCDSCSFFYFCWAQED